MSRTCHTPFPPPTKKLNSVGHHVILIIVVVACNPNILVLVQYVRCEVDSMEVKFFLILINVDTIFVVEINLFFGGIVGVRT